ncbi:MAG: hypothetical protein HMLKMBBP_01661 [Planctomycetes bacterium]|nr:hypothetical protein [Planctomycetota bacterium]
MRTVHLGVATLDTSAVFPTIRGSRRLTLSPRPCARHRPRTWSEVTACHLGLSFRAGVRGSEVAHEATSDPVADRRVDRYAVETDEGQSRKAGRCRRRTVALPASASMIWHRPCHGRHGRCGDLGTRCGSWVPPNRVRTPLEASYDDQDQPADCRKQRGENDGIADFHHGRLSFREFSRRESKAPGGPTPRARGGSRCGVALGPLPNRDLLRRRRPLVRGVGVMRMPKLRVATRRSADCLNRGYHAPWGNLPTGRIFATS